VDPPLLPLQIIHVNLTSENPQPITTGGTLNFTYSVTWKPSTIPYARRFERYLDYNFFEHQVCVCVCVCVCVYVCVCEGERVREVGCGVHGPLL
jgi:hypothetical protein